MVRCWTPLESQPPNVFIEGAHRRRRPRVWADPWLVITRVAHRLGECELSPLGRTPIQNAAALQALTAGAWAGTFSTVRWSVKFAQYLLVSSNVEPELSVITT